MKTIRKNIQMEKLDGTVLDIRATVDNLGDKCGQLPGSVIFSTLVPGSGSLVPGSGRFQPTNLMGYS